MTFELTCHRLAQAVPLAPARRERDIFDRNPHAYRCLPLSTANAAGWELLCPAGFTATWDGGTGKDAIQVVYDDAAAPQFAKSHFAFGILTLETGWLFKTTEGFGLWVMGSPNDPKDGISPLTGLVETDWLPYPFTMNWQFTRPGSIRFEKGEPFCFISPGLIQPVAACQPLELDIGDAPDLQADLEAWTRERDGLMQRMRAGEPDALKQAWGRRYFRGEAPPGATEPPAGAHLHKMRTKAPIRHAPAPAPAQPAYSTPSIAGAPVQDVGRLADDGQFIPGGRTRIVRSAAEARAAGLVGLVQERALDEPSCQLLSDAYEASASEYSHAERDEFWNGRMLAYDRLRQASPAAAAAMVAALTAGAGRVLAHFGINQEIYADGANLVGWREGMFMPVHADDAYEVDGQKVLAHRAYSGIYYLNDDYEGGGLYLPRQDVLIQPQRGMFVSLPGDESHAHGVVRIDAGRRVTMPFFLTLSPDHAARDLPSPLAAPVRARLTFTAPAGNYDLEIS